MIQYYYTKKEWGVVMEKEELKILEELRRILNSKNEAIVILNNYFKGGVGKSKLSTMLFLMWSMRQNEYLADEFAYKIGFGLELATVLDQHISDVPHDGFLSAIYSTHPCNDDRVAALQNLGVPYSRY